MKNFIKKIIIFIIFILFYSYFLISFDRALSIEIKFSDKIIESYLKK